MTVFERLPATTRERGNLGFLMYLADGAGYLDYTAVMIGKSFLQEQGDFLQFHTILSWLLTALASVGVVLGRFDFAGREKAQEVPAGGVS
ncbi:MAG: DUF5690 family protein [Isosphaeraceae bacterium]